MHILVINDDGPPSNQSSPYIHSLVKTLQDAGHIVSVILPHIQRSWIGKAHFVGEVTKPTYFRPGTLHKDDGTIHPRPLSLGTEKEEWILVNGTPATCAQLGLYHFFQDKGPVDLVVSGPNYGRNSTSLFSLSSGTVGGAMEAAVCRRRAIALSYAFYSRDHDPDLIAGASRLSVKLIEHLHSNWGQDVDLYTVNVPLIKDVENHKIMYTYALQNYWSSGTSFQEIEPEEDAALPEKQEQETRHQTEDHAKGAGNPKTVSTNRHRHFKWAPKFTDVHKSVKESSPGNDGWALEEGYTSVTPLKANFMHASSQIQGELKMALPALIIQQPRRTPPPYHFFALIEYQDPYVQPLILSALQTHLPLNSYTLVSSLSLLPHPSYPFLQISQYETFPFSHLTSHPHTCLANAYVIRKALIRKHYLAHTISTCLVKHPNSPLKSHTIPTVTFELDYAEFLDDALLEAYELHESFARNAPKAPSDREWWILKPSMSDRGQGIRLFSTETELSQIFEQWEAENPESDSESVSDQTTPSSPPPATAPLPPQERSGLITSQLRHFIAQPYITPLLLPTHNNHKFHIRAYVLAVGSLRVYVYRDMLALFAAVPYHPPGDKASTSSAARATEEDKKSSTLDEMEIDMRPHLTNTCLEDSQTHAGTVTRFWALPSSAPQLSTHWRDKVWEGICGATGALFEAAITQPTNFQPVPNAFEVFGLDWLVDERGDVWLLEVNAFPDFGMTGEGLRDVVRGLWEGVVGVAVGGFFGGWDGEDGEGKAGDGEDGEGKAGDGEEEGGRWGLRKVLDVDMGRR